MDEFTFIRTLLAPLAATAPGAFGLRDDAASLAVPPGHDLVLTADALTADVHFRAGDPPALIAQKALRVNLSDLAAKGATPIGFLMTLALPRGTSESWLAGFAAGLQVDIAEFATPLLGGDTTTTPGPLSVSITALGLVPTGGMIRRAGAKAGDLLCVSGTIGDGALGLTADRWQATAAAKTFLTDRYRRPQPRLALGRALRGIAHAALDISDGLVADIGHLCRESGVAAVIDRERLPLSPAVQTVLAGHPEAFDRVLGGGDDYELAFAAPPTADLDALASLGLVAVTAIGRFAAGEGVRVLDASGIEYPVAATGYRHF